MRYIIVLILLGTFSSTACNGAEEGVQPSPTPSPAVAQPSPTPTTTPSPTPEPTATPAPLSIFFTSSREPMGTYLMDADGSNVVRIGSILGVQGLEVAVWSPDGSKVAFVKCPEGPSSDSELLVVNADGTGEVNVSNNTSPDVLVCGTDGGIGSIDWSPDGNRLVFHSMRDPTGLYIVNADGSGLAFLADGSHPSGSPDGQWIAFTRHPDEANWQVDLEIIRPDGSGRMLLAEIPCSYTALSSGGCVTPKVRWSPDGTMLLFSASPSPADPDYPDEAAYDVYTVRSDGSVLTNITRSTTRSYASRWVDCTRPTAGCEARVTNISTEGLNLRTGSGLGASTAGKLSEGDVVCFIGPQSYVDGFKWWPLHAVDGAEGWAAAFDPGAVDEPWLTPTGDPCEGEPAGD